MMTNKSTAFILNSGKYQEIPSTEVMEKRRFKPPYDERYFIKECGYLLEVTKADWEQFRKADNREKYLQRQAKAYGEFNYHAFDTDKYSGEELIVDVLTNVENEVVRKLMMEKVGQMVLQLPPADHDLIHALFYDNISESDYATSMGLTRQMINLRKCLILRGMKKILEK